MTDSDTPAPVEELVERLREMKQDSWFGGLAEEAADRLAELEKENGELKAALARLQLYRLRTEGLSEEEIGLAIGGIGLEG